MTPQICEKRWSVLEAAGHCLVMGGPGSGKTTLALLKAVERIDDGLAAGQTVLFLSFSRAAVARIADALKEQVSAEKQRLLFIQTFHSFFWQLLQGYAYLLGIPRRLSILLAHDEKAMCDGIGPEHAEWSKWEAKRRELCYQEGRVCFDLFAPLAAELLRRAKRIRDRLADRHPLVLVDEAQDTNNEQWECVRLLGEKAQVVCLADPDQMIYDFLPGVGPERIAAIRAALTPHEVDLQAENNRSPGTDIAVFARDIYGSRVRGSSYNGISRYRFSPRPADRDRAIRMSVGILCKRLPSAKGQGPKSIALVASYASGVAVITAALQQDVPIPHRVLFDEAFALLSARAAAFMLEPKDHSQHNHDVATLLEMAGAAFRTKGTQRGRQQWRKCAAYAARCRQGEVIRFNIVSSAGELISAARDRILSGDPHKDWSAVKQAMKQVGDEAFGDMGRSLDYLPAFGRGHRMSENLSSLWLEHGAYHGAREALDAALAQEQLLSAEDQLHGIYIMNMHKCKGKQFDGVVLYRQQYHSPFVWRDEQAPYTKSRRLLHMAITRAESHVLILDEASSKCPIIGPHTL